jgi:hypothetical protein
MRETKKVHSMDQGIKEIADMSVEEVHAYVVGGHRKNQYRRFAAVGTPP